MAEQLVVGVDVGETNTDAVIMRGREVLSQSKRLTTQDVMTGIVSSISTAIARLASSSKKNEPARTSEIAEGVCRVNIGTTHFSNALLQKKGLARVCVIRLCGSSTTALPPFVNFPEELARTIRSSVHLLRGGYEFDGKEIEPLDELELRECLARLRDCGSMNIVICGVFSPACASQECRTLEVAREVHPAASYTLSHQVGGLGLLERENAAILNEALRPLSEVTIKTFQDALRNLQLTCPLYFTQNNGTLSSCKQAREFPIFSFSSGPTNSMRGGMWLSGLSDGVLVDIGGTTTKVGVMKSGFPQEASSHKEIGGVPINFRMPDILSIGLGGGSVVHVLKEEGQKVTVLVGMDSVGCGLFEQAVSFGGETLTTTDVAMAAGVSEPLPQASPPSLRPGLVYSVMKELHNMLAAVIGRAKMGGEDVPVILVGGGSMLVDSLQSLKGVSLFHRPRHYEVANAVGAALAHVRICDFGNQSVTIATDKKTSTENAIDGPQEDVTVWPELRIGTAAEGTGYTHLDCYSGSPPQPPPSLSTDKDLSCWPSPSEHVQQLDQQAGLPEPDINHSMGVWTLSAHDISCLAVGAGILGCGGGGSPSVGKLLATKALQEGKVVQVQNPYRVPVGMSGWVAPVAFMGAPTVLVEKVACGQETRTAMRALQQLLASGLYKKGGRDGGVDSVGRVQVARMEGQPDVWRARGYQGVDLTSVPQEWSVQYLMPVEIGGINSIEPLLVGADLGLPVLDADGMGRAFPQLQMYLPFIEGCRPYPICLADNKGEVVAVSHCPSAQTLEGVLRMETVRMGGASGIAMGCLSLNDVMEKCVLLSMSRAWAVGRAVVRASRRRQPPHCAIVESRNGRLLINGKIIDVLRSSEGGFNRGRVVVEGLGAHHAGQYLLVDYQNENLLARHSSHPTSDISHVPRPGDVTTPDLITIIDAATGYPATTEEIQYGMMVAVVAMAADPKLKTKRALKIVGPRAFHYDFDYLDFSQTVT